jgi:hypothetical protein
VTTTITTAARRIVCRLNAMRGAHVGGFCQFAADGLGGANHTAK